MKLPAVGIMITLIIAGCSAEQDERSPATSSVEPSVTDTLSLPDHIGEVDNLTVYPPDMTPSDSIRFERVSVMSDSVGIGMMGRILVDRSGNVYVVEGGIRSPRQTVHIYSADGTYDTTLGRAGEGPGEFQNLSTVRIHQDRLYAFDRVLARFSIFSLQFREHLQTVTINSGSRRENESLQGLSLVDFYVWSDSTLLLEFREPMRPDNPDSRMRYYFEMDLNGQIAEESLFKQKETGFYPGTGIPGPVILSVRSWEFTRHALMAVSDERQIYSAWTEDLLVRVYDRDGEYRRAFYHPYENLELNEDELHEAYRNSSQPFREALRNTDMPETWPAMDRMLIDDENRIWISTITDDEEHYEWWVLEENGRLLARFNWPGKRLQRTRAEREIKTIRNGYLYAYETGDDPYFGEIVKYRIMMEE